jgi:hypothetical protein
MRLEEEFWRQLTNARIAGLPASKCSESASAEPLDIAEVWLRGDFFVKEVHAVENVEESARNCSFQRSVMVKFLKSPMSHSRHQLLE